MPRLRFAAALTALVALATPALAASTPTPRVPFGTNYAVERAVPGAAVWRGGTFRRHDGFYARLGLSSVILHVAREGKAANAENTLTGHGTSLTSGGLFEFSLGGTPAAGVVLAGTWLQHASPPADLRQAGNRTLRLGALEFGLLGMTLDWFPRPYAGLHGSLTLGFGYLAAAVPAAPFEIGGSGAAASVGLGWDFWVRNQWAFGLALRGSAARLSKSGDATGSGAEQIGATSVGLGFSLLHH